MVETVLEQGFLPTNGEAGYLTGSTVRTLFSPNFLSLLSFVMFNLNCKVYLSGLLQQEVRGHFLRSFTASL